MTSVITVKGKGDFAKTKSFLHVAKNLKTSHVLKKYGRKGTDSLEKATPIETGKTASSWYYELEKSSAGNVLRWNNSNVKDGWYNNALMLQYGHGTRNGGWVEGRDYINPALTDVYDKLADEVWNEVTK